MAIYSLRVSTVRRNQGRSASAAAAYRAGVRLFDNRLHYTYDYRAKGGIEATQIYIPDNAPLAYRDREALWNAAERADKRMDSVPAREILVALPHELDRNQRKELVDSFVHSHLRSRGMIADVAIHQPNREGDERNYHAHILVTTRAVDEQGFGKKVPEWHSREFVKDIRREWAQEVNASLERHAPQVERVSEKSFAERGINREPTIHLGRQATAMERRGDITALGQNNRDIAQSNAATREAIRRHVAKTNETAREGKWQWRDSQSIIDDMTIGQKTLAQELAKARAERDAIRALPRPMTVKQAETLLTSKHERDVERTRRAVIETDNHARKEGVSLNHIRQWYEDPGNALLGAACDWDRALEAAVRARQARETAKRELTKQREWLSTDQGKDTVANLREPSLEARRPLRTLERRIARLEKTYELAERDIEKVKLARLMGHERLRVPPDARPPLQGKSDIEYAVNHRSQMSTLSIDAHTRLKMIPPPELDSARQYLRTIPRGQAIPLPMFPHLPGGPNRGIERDGPEIGL